MTQQDGRRRHFVYPSAEFVTMPPDKYTFRYELEKRDQGTIKLIIRVNDYEGPVKAVLACVTAEDPPMPHPNKVKCPKRRGCADGVCTIQKNITKMKNIIVFNQIGIQRVKMEVVEAALRIRTSNIDFPFVRGYDGGSRDVRTIDLTRVRFACQVLILDAAGALSHPLGPVTTNRVTHYSEGLKIIDASHDCDAATGGLRVFLFTAKLPKSVGVVFRERDSEWRAQGKAVVQHKNVALKFTAPPYHNPYCHEPVKVYYFMVQTMDSEDEQENQQNRRDFTYLPIPDEDVLATKCHKKFNKWALNIFNGVKTGQGSATAATHEHDSTAAATHQQAAAAAVGLKEVMDIPPYQRGGGYIPEAQHVQHEDHPIPLDLLEFVMQYESQEMEVHTTAQHNLVQPLSIPRWLLEQSMDVDLAGSEDRPG